MIERTMKADKGRVLNTDFSVVEWTIAMSDNNSNAHSEAAGPRSTRKPLRFKRM